MNTLDLYWHPEASEDLNAIVHQCSWYFGSASARKVRNQIWHDAELLQSHPRLGKVEPLLVGCTSLEYRSLLVDTHTKIIYTVHTDFVYIHLLWDVRQDEAKLPQAAIRRYQMHSESGFLLNESELDYGMKKEE